MIKIKRLPAFAVVAIALGSLLLLSGSAYAAYQLLWQKPQVTVSSPEKSVSGRDEVAISLEQCGDDSKATRYELKRNASITADQIKGVVEARCELDAIGTWAMSTFPNDRFGGPSERKEHTTSMSNASMATTIKSMSADSVTFTGLTKYNQTDKTLPVTPSVRYIVDGHDAKASDISTSDPIVYITTVVTRMTPQPGCNDQHCSMSGELVSETLQAIVKLSMPLENYDQFAWQSLTERTTCQGNPNDSCLTGFIGGIDLYMGSATIEMGKTEMKEIHGTITEMNGSSVVIKSSSGTLFTINTPSDVISKYNTTKASQYYNNQTVKVGSTLRVSYIESPNEHSKTLNSKTLMSVMFQTEAVGKSDIQTAY